MSGTIFATNNISKKLRLKSKDIKILKKSLTGEVFEIQKLNQKAVIKIVLNVLEFETDNTDSFCLGDKVELSGNINIKNINKAVSKEKQDKILLCS